jgi:hypothetical protein
LCAPGGSPWAADGGQIAAPQSAAKPLAVSGRYYTGRQPGAALQNTAICPAALPPDAARANGQSHSTHDTVIRPGPHSCPFSHACG